ncbi:MAG: PepSY domain-containing protein [Peptostreptococcaceae bacterium]|nr:PepSY domain-containing protein [Peptostreptococcaceae bacterium]
MKLNRKIKKLPMVMAATILASTLATGSIEAFAASKIISASRAKKIALRDAGLKEKDVTFVKVQLEYEDGRQEYDVEFYRGNVEYDYEIDARSGRILEKDQDIENFTIPQKPAKPAKLISASKAKKIALRHAGLRERDVTFVKVQLDYDNGIQVYDVEFYHGNYEYDYEIDARSGRILDVDWDIEDFVIPAPKPQPPAALIGEAKAKQIALNHAGLRENEVTFVKVKLDYDDGVQVYDVEFYKGNVEYDYEIDAVTGAIREVDRDIEHFVIPAPKPQPPAALIGDAKAKQIALNHAGLRENEVTFVKVKLDYDDGVQVYDVEFYKGNVEYDYEIDAVTGAIREVDRDIENFVIPAPKPQPPANLIGDAKAKQIALSHAGLRENEVTFVKVRLGYDDGVQVYDVEFYKGNVEYDYEIDALTGEIREVDWDIENFIVPAPKPQPPAALIGEAKAKSIALNHAGLRENEVTFVKVKLDYDDGVQVYDVEFYSGNYEFDYEIDAVTGAIREMDRDIEHFVIPAPKPQPPTGYIGEERAKQIALNHAGLNASEVFFKKVKLDREDGMMVYEIEFKHYGYEYEYDIEATTGQILKVDIDD